MKHKDERQEYIINQNYQRLYKIALDKSKECYNPVLLTAAMNVDGDLFPELKSAEISIYMIGGLGRSMLHGVTFEEIDSSHTKMTIYSHLGRNNLSMLKKQFTGECKQCGCEE